MDFVWNADQAEQVRARSVEALNRQAQELTEAQARFVLRATELEGEAARLAALPPPMMTVFYTITNSRGEERERSERVVDQDALQQRMQRVADLQAQAAEIRRVAGNFGQAAGELGRGIAESNRLFESMHREAQEIDRMHAGRARAAGQDMEAYIRRMEGLRDSIGGPVSAANGGETQGRMPWDLGPDGERSLMGLLLAWLAGMPPTCAMAGDPVNMSTGNFVYSKEDISIPGRHPLAFTRTYNSIGGATSALGGGWTHSLNIALHDAHPYIYVTFPDGHAERYQDAGGGAYVSPLGSRHELSRRGGYWALTAPDMTAHIFNESGRLERVAGPNGSAVSLAYKGGLLESASTPSGSLSFAHGRGGELLSVTDHAGRAATFRYEDGMLAEATQPCGGAYRYKYGAGGRLVEIAGPPGGVSVANEFDDKGRVTRQLLADGGAVEYRHDDGAATATFIAQNGAATAYKRDSKRRTSQISHADGTAERFAHDNRDNLTLRVDRNGNRHAYEYDLLGNMTASTDPLGNKTTMEHNPFGKPTSVSLPNGGEVRCGYDSKGNLTAISDPLGRQTSFALDAEGKVAAAAMPDGSTIRLDYDARGNIAAMTDGMGNVTRFEHDSLNRAVKTVDGEGAATRYAYNLRGDIEKVTDALGNARVYEYGPTGKLAKVTDFNGAVTAYSYNSFGKAEKITGPMGGTTVLTYDKAWNLASVTDPLGCTTTFEYDANNRLSRSTDPEGSVTKYRHDACGNLVSATDPLGMETRIFYDALNRPRQVVEPDGAATSAEYDSMGNVTKVTDALGNATLREHDLAGQLTKVTDALGNETRIAYTPLGKIASVTDAKGAARTFGYHPGGLLKKAAMPDGETESYEYDKNGNVRKVTDGLGFVTTLERDCLNRVIKSTNALGHSKHYEHDAMGNVTKVTDENGNATRYKYSLLGDVIEATDAAGHATGYAYDAAGRLTELKQCVIMGVPQVTSYGYDKAGNIVAITSPLGDAVRYGYDAAGNVVSKLDEDGNETLFAYNLAGRLQKASLADGRTVEFGYDALRRLTEMKDWLGTTSIELDKLGRAAKITDHDGSAVGYAYDALGLRAKLTYPDGTEARYEYTPGGKMVKVTAASKAATVEGITAYAYDPMGRVSERTLPDGTTTKHAYDPLGQLSSLAHHGKTGGLLDSFKYAYDPSGNMTRIEKTRAGIESDSGIFSYAYDPLNRLIEAVTPTATRQYEYDPLGNRTLSRQTSGGTTTETRHSFNERNQLTRTEASGDITDYEYDRRGNLTRETLNGKLRLSYEYDAANMMSKAHNPAMGDAEYTYNGFRSRLAKMENYNAALDARLDPLRETKFVLDMTRPYDNLLMTKGAENRSFVWGNGLLSAHGENKHDGFHYLHDHLGSPIRLTDDVNGTGNSSAMSYDEFGRPLAKANIHQPFGYTGYQTENIAGSYFAQARYYMPSVGRFGAEDIIRDGNNWYDYCRSNPINLVDLNGLIPRAPNTGVSYIFYDPNMFRGNSSNLVTAWSDDLMRFHGYNSVNQVNIVPVQGSAGWFIDYWNGNMSNNVDTVVLLGHATNSFIRMYSPIGLGKNYDFNRIRDYWDNFNLTQNQIGQLNNRNIETLILLGCGMGSGDNNFARDMALQGLAGQIIASYSNTWFYHEQGYPRIRSTDPVEPSRLNPEPDKPFMYPHSGFGFLVFLPDGSTVQIGNFFENLTQMLNSAMHTRLSCN